MFDNDLENEFENVNLYPFVSHGMKYGCFFTKNNL